MSNGIEVIGYIRASADGKPEWSEDCVCKDAVYPTYDGDESVSMAICRLSDAQSIIAQQAALIAELEQQRSGVVLPERANESEGNSYTVMQAMARNQALDEVARLNPPSECVAVPRELLARMVDMLDDCRGELYRHGVSPSCLVDPTLNSPSLSRLDVIREQSRTLLAQQGKENGDA